MHIKLFLAACLLALVSMSAVFGQKFPQPIPLLATNNSGFLENGPGGPDNLVLFEVTPIPDLTFDDIGPIPFTILGSLTLGLDLNGDGADDSLGNFSGLEWSTGLPGQGTLIGCVLNEGDGNGEFYQINPATAQPTLIGQSPVDPVSGEQLAFSDLAVNPVTGLMFGLMNDITDDGMGGLEFGPNTIWVDTNGDLVPDTLVGDEIRGPDPFCIGVIQTLASGMTFDSFGRLFIYDSVDEVVHGFGFANPVVPSNPLGDPCVFDFGLLGFSGDTSLTSSELTVGNGLAVVNQFLLIGSDAAGRNTFVSFFDLPDPGVEPDPVPEVFPMGFFERQSFQSSMFAGVAIGDLVGAEAGLTGLPTFFPDSIVVNNGMAAKDAVLEAVAVSDDFRYCLFAGGSNGNLTPLDVDFLFTLPNPSEIDQLGIEVEVQGNVSNISQLIRILNVNTGQFEVVGVTPVSNGIDETTTINLTLNIENYVNPANGTLVCKIQNVSTGLVLLFPWQVKYDSVLVLAE